MQDIQKLGIHSTKPIDNDNFDDPEERYEWEPFDDVDPVDANSRFNGRTEDSDLEDTDLHILPSENGRFSAYADIRGGIGDNIWNRTDQSGIQNIGNSTVEWNMSIITDVQNLIDAMEEWQSR